MPETRLIRKSELRLLEESRAYISCFKEEMGQQRGTIPTWRTRLDIKSLKVARTLISNLNLFAAIDNELRCTINFFLNCNFVFEHRLMCTVSEFSSVRFAPGNYQILTGVTSKLPWWKIEYYELSSGDVWNELLKRDPAWKTSSVNWNNQC